MDWIWSVFLHYGIWPMIVAFGWVLVLGFLKVLEFMAPPCWVVTGVNSEGELLRKEYFAWSISQAREQYSLDVSTYRHGTIVSCVPKSDDDRDRLVRNGYPYGLWG